MLDKACSLSVILLGSVLLGPACWKADNKVGTILHDGGDTAGGGTGAGGSPGAGGAVSTGGLPGAGGAVGTGGLPGAGGAIGTVGLSGTGGTVGTMPDAAVDLDLDLPIDRTARDRAPESAVADAAVADAVEGPADIPPEAAREVLPFAVDGPLASFCSGDSARMVVNGIESHPAVSGIYYLLSCCAAGALAVSTATFIEPIAVGWQDWGMVHTDNPVTFDLADLPAGFVVRAVAGCDPQDTLCTLPCDPRDTDCTNLGDGYNSGFSGVLAITPSSEGFDMRLCLHVEEPAGSPHTIIHSLDLYVPHAFVSYH